MDSFQKEETVYITSIAVPIAGGLISAYLTCPESYQSKFNKCDKRRVTILNEALKTKAAQENRLRDYSKVFPTLSVITSIALGILWSREASLPFKILVHSAQFAWCATSIDKKISPLKTGLKFLVRQAVSYAIKRRSRKF